MSAGRRHSRDAQVVFLGRSEASQLGTVIRSIPPNILVVTESEDGLQHGSIINFIIVRRAGALRSVAGRRTPAQHPPQLAAAFGGPRSHRRPALK
jgi:hypothetical protein